jgi:hypothetical protein
VGDSRTVACGSGNSGSRRGANPRENRRPAQSYFLGGDAVRDLSAFRELAKPWPRPCSEFRQAGAFARQWRRGNRFMDTFWGMMLIDVGPEKAGSLKLE